MIELQNKLIKEKLQFHDIDISTILFHLHEGVLIADTEGTILYYNTTQSQIDDIDINYAIGKKITDLYRLSDSDSTTMRCIRTSKPVRNHVMIYQSSSGKVANVISNVFPLFRDGQIIGAISFTKDYQMLENIVSMCQSPEVGSARDDMPMLMKRPAKKTKLRDNGTRFTFTDLVGSNHKLINAINMAKLAADSPSPIMLSGETGTGKEIFAQSIHNCRASSKERFIPINCSAIPENLLEGILFGTSKGAFTGSIDKAGLFEQANGGTIFLDELDSMPLSLQSKVLRVVQEKRVRRLGSLEETQLNVKIISTVSKDPDTIIKSGALRLDLFYRMGVVFILIPPLRERMDDIGSLVCHFIRKFNGQLGEEVKEISDRVRAVFYDYPWPGNVRELEHVIEGAMNIVNGEQIIRISHLPCHVLNLLKASKHIPEPDYLPGHESSFSKYGGDFTKECQDFNITFKTSSYGNPAVVVSSSSEQALKKMTLLESQCANENECICNALKATNGNAAKAARILGLSPQSFHYKVKKYRINKKQFAADSSNDD